ncbi:MAG: hypothetical protein M2R45_03374 [Verrucomicrobia subdivision 3 bacterium]|nr:hypothetical protein [Limisphaerales bacterium]MCS1416713.1 hypothetical protein [Limisphaerales bacterium]
MKGETTTDRGIKREMGTLQAHDLYVSKNEHSGFTLSKKPPRGSLIKYSLSFNLPLELHDCLRKTGITENS